MCIQNKLSDLNNHLFAQMERLGEEDLSPEDLDKEIKRAKAITGVATQIINNGNLALNAQKYFEEYGYGQRDREIPEMLRLKETEVKKE